MANENLTERRQVVLKHYINDGAIDAEFKKKTALQFGCSTATIYSDWLSINQSIHGGLVSATPKMKRNIIQRDNGICQYCGIIATAPIVEHIVPSSQGGPTIEHNLVCSCQKCNTNKRDRVWVPMNLDSITEGHAYWKDVVIKHSTHPGKRGAPKKLDGAIRITASIDTHQDQGLKSIMKESRKSQSEVIRSALDQLIARVKEDPEFLNEDIEDYSEIEARKGRQKGEPQTERNIKLTDTHWEFLKALGGGYRPGIIKLITDQQEKTK